MNSTYENPPTKRGKTQFIRGYVIDEKRTILFYDETDDIWFFKFQNMVIQFSSETMKKEFPTINLNHAKKWLLEF